MERRTGRGLGERIASTFEAQLPTSLAELRNYLQDEPEAEITTLGREEYLEFTRSVREAVPDLRLGIEETITEPNKIAIRWRGTGTHDGEILGIEPTGRDVTLSGIRIDHFNDGRLAAFWTLFEQWSPLRQIDVTEPSAPLATAGRVTATPVVTQLSAPAENETLARTEITDVWNRGRREALDRVFSDDCVLHLDGDDDLYGRASYWEFVRRYRDAFPDLELTVEDVVSKGDKIVLRMTMRGTQEGSFLSVDPTGRRVEVARMVIHHIDDGRIVETGIIEDTVRLLHQLDV